ncbi:hypothetical protein BJX63DRAFT_418052 [Aspergillus granulosus]|uniref:Protein kinase domain-containing protein n=1 Tax=Aspergillus granulosus TaxID=176169 RepID=A0ABR4I1S1_9EURO
MSSTIEVGPSGVEVSQILRRTKTSAILKVTIHGEPRVMKVYRDRLPSQYDSPEREIHPFVCESSAYQRLREKGLCARGVVPYFYGTVTNIQPDHWQSLSMLFDDVRLLHAVILEDIDNMHQLDLSTFSESRLIQMERILQDIHEAGVLHGDPDPRNMMICPGRCGKPDRVLWIDFDRAQLLPEDNLSARKKRWLRNENELMDYFAKSLPEDYREGKLSRTWDYYYTWN